MNRWVGWFLVFITGLALVLRVWDLGQRPMHTDESVHAIKFKSLWENGVYKYDPNEYHGPSLYYATLPAAWLHSLTSAAILSENTLRLIPALFGAALVLTLLLATSGQGRWPTVWAALFTALSPAMVFYSRYYIHEMLLVFFTWLLIAALWAYHKEGTLDCMLLAGLGLGLMVATKETFVFNLAALGIGAAMTWTMERFDKGAFPSIPRQWRISHVLAGALLAATVSLVLFSSFFTNPAGPLDSLRTYLPWFSRAGGNSPHIHPWHYYLGLMTYTHRPQGPIWSEALILILGLIGLLAGLLKKGLGTADYRWVRWIGFYTLILTALYSLIAYKTPWCLLGFWHGWILLAGVGASAVIGLFRPKSWKVFASLALLAATAQLAGQACRASFSYAADPRNPFVYAHTLPDVKELARKVQNIVGSCPQPDKVLVKVIANQGDYWPLPWYFRTLNNVGWYPVPTEPLDADIYVISPNVSSSLEKKIGATHMFGGFFGHRPAVFLQLVVRREIWENYLKNKPKSSDDD